MHDWLARSEEEDLQSEWSVLDLRYSDETSKFLWTYMGRFKFWKSKEELCFEPFIRKISGFLLKNTFSEISLYSIWVLDRERKRNNIMREIKRIWRQENVRQGNTEIYVQRISWGRISLISRVRLSRYETNRFVLNLTFLDISF